MGKKIMYEFSQFYRKGGTERILVSKMNHLAEDYGYEVHSLAPYQREDQPNAFPTSPKIHQHRLGLPYLRIPLLRPWQYFIDRRRVIDRLQKVIDEVRPDILVVSTVAVRNLLGVRLPEGTKLVLESHISRSHMWLEHPWLIRRRRYRELAREEKRASRIVSLTTADAANWPQDKVEVIENFLETPPVALPWATDSLTGERITQKKAVALGRFHNQKGFDMLVTAWRKVAEKHPDWHLQIAGYEWFKGGEEELRQHTRSCGVADTVTIGPEIDDIAAYFRTADFFVMSSRYEGFGLVLLEAMTCGLPCVAFDCPSGPADIITHGEDGYLVPPDDIDALAEAICRMIEHDDERLRMAKATHAKAMRFDRDDIMRRWNDLFSKLIE